MTRLLGNLQILYGAKVKKPRPLKAKKILFSPDNNLPQVQQLFVSCCPKSYEENALSFIRHNSIKQLLENNITLFCVGFTPESRKTSNLFFVAEWLKAGKCGSCCDVLHIHRYAIAEKTIRGFVRKSTSVMRDAESYLRISHAIRFLPIEHSMQN